MLASAQDRSEQFFIERPIKSFVKEQDRLVEEFEEARDEVVKARNAQILAELWQRGLLNNKIKDHLVSKYYRALLFQFKGRYPAYHFVVRVHHDFPFPGVWTKYTPTLRANGKAIWAPDSPQTQRSLAVNNSLLTSFSGARDEIGEGVVLQYSIKMQQEVDKEIVWEKTILTNKLVVQPYQD